MIKNAIINYIRGIIPLSWRSHFKKFIPRFLKPYLTNDIRTINSQLGQDYWVIYDVECLSAWIW